MCVLQWISCPLLSSTDEPEVYLHAQVMEASVDASTPSLPPSPLPLSLRLSPSLSLNLESHLVFALFSCHNRLGHDIKYLFYVRAASLSSYGRNALGKTKGAPSPPHLRAQVQYSELDQEKPIDQCITYVYISKLIVLY